MLAIASCGSSGSSAPTMISMDQFAHKADLICNNASSKQTEIAAIYIEHHPNFKEADLVVPAGIPPLEEELNQLSALGLPRGHEEEAEVFLEESKEALKELKKEPNRALSQKNNPYKTANELGEALGLGDCRRNP